jgi:hypothetical protein
MTDEAQFLDKLDKLIDKLDRPAIPVEIALWDAKMCGAYLQVSAAHYRDRIACKPDAPKAIILPTGGGQGTPRWKAREVIEWAEGKQERRKAA